MNTNRRISITGVGYTGLALATAFAKSQEVIAYDIDTDRLDHLRHGELPADGSIADNIDSPAIHYTDDPKDLKNADLHFVCVSALVKKDSTPDLSCLVEATKTLAGLIKKGDIIVYETTVYPGTTEEICIPTLEKYSNMKCGKDFFVGYSPERINPCDYEHTLSNIAKVVSACDCKTAELLAQIYKKIINAEVHIVKSIRSAEAVKLIENIQRDVNIAFLNEASLLIHKLGLDSREIYGAMRTKWNALPFKPGFVGGYCININPYYLLYSAERSGFHSNIVQSCRKVNEYIPRFIVDEVDELASKLSKKLHACRVAILGVGYKENCPAFFNSASIEIYELLKDKVDKIYLHDPLVKKDELEEKLAISLNELEEINNIDILLLLVAHDDYKRLTKDDYLKFLNPSAAIMDVKGVLDEQDFEKTNVKLWTL